MTMKDDDFGWRFTMDATRRPADLPPGAPSFNLIRNRHPPSPSGIRNPESGIRNLETRPQRPLPVSLLLRAVERPCLVETQDGEVEEVHAESVATVSYTHLRAHET